jgi:hypothetical protein
MLSKSLVFCIFFTFRIRVMDGDLVIEMEPEVVEEADCS